jgi:ketosteroid isomerase-like protein
LSNNHTPAGWGRGYFMKRFTTILFIFGIIIAVLGCHRETEQDKVKKVITDIQKAAEEKDVKKIMNNLSKTYSDPQGFNYETIKRPLLGYFLIYPKISVFINNLQISIENTSARAVFRTVLTSANKTGSPADLIPQSLGMYDFNVLLKKESDGWKVTSATWTHVEMPNTSEADDS